MAWVAILFLELAGATTAGAQATSTFRWWHNVEDNWHYGYSFGETLGVHPSFIVTGIRDADVAATAQQSLDCLVCQHS